MEVFTLDRWSPYAVGIGIGVLSWVAFLISDKPIGCSTAFARSAGLLERLFRGSKVNDKPYYREFVPQIDWEWMLVAGILIGAFLASVLSGQFSWSLVPDMWAAEIGPGGVPRVIVAVLGGFFVAFGARWAGGCTSGHGISGTLQLAVSGWIAAAGFFVGGIITAMLIYRVIF